MLTLKTKTAKLSEFRSPTPRILYGETLADVRNIQTSIEQHGLLSPLVVSNNDDRLIVIDGRKRLAALRRMQFEGKLPRSLVHIPYVVVDEEHMSNTVKRNNTMALLSNSEQYQTVKKMRGSGFSVTEIANRLHCSANHITALLDADKLSDMLRDAFLNDVLSLKQVRAFATIPNVDAQDSLLIALGPFAEESDILDAIAKGETILNIDDDNVIILPSRAQPALFMEHAA